MELILATTILLLTVALVMSEVQPQGKHHERARAERDRARRPAGEPVVLDVAPPALESSSTMVDAAAPAPVVAEILPSAARVESVVALDDEPPGLGIPELRPDPDRLIQTEVLVPVRPLEHTLASVRLLVTVLLAGALAGLTVLLTGRALGQILQRIAGAS